MLRPRRLSVARTRSQLGSVLATGYHLQEAGPDLSSTRELVSILERIDGRGYRAYADVRGRHDLGDCALFVDHVQGDPFAAPSKLRVRIPMQRAALPSELFTGRVRRIALADFLARGARRALSRGPDRQMGSGRSGVVDVDAGGQEVLERSAVVIDPEFVELRLEAGLPAQGRRVLGRQAIALLAETIPEGATAALCWDRLDAQQARDFVACVENQEHVRSRLGDLGLVAFVGSGSLLPRESGASDRPMSGVEAVRFETPPSLAVRIKVPNPTPDGSSEVVGLGIPRGVTLIVGGGFHGKSTLLRALERGVYAHIPGDGRELVVADPNLVKVRAEDGRAVARVDIHAFVETVPGGARDTRSFSTDDASGSTSQAASIVEAIEAGATGLLLDEDTCATNFMVRDARMQALVPRDDEPITPFVDRVRELFDQGVSTVLVMGGSGDYFDVADHVMAMRDYRLFDVTGKALEIARRKSTGRTREVWAPLGDFAARSPDPKSFDPSRGKRAVRLDVPERDAIVYGRERLDLRAVEQLVDRSQTRAVALAIHLAATRLMKDGASLPQILDALEALLDHEGLDVLDPFGSHDRPGAHPGNLARPRRFEIAAAINRLRGVRMRDA